MENKKIARLYTRVSTAEQRRKDTSCKDQETHLREYCELNGFEIAGRLGVEGKPKAYTDNGVSGGKMNRPAFLELQEDLQPGDTVIVTFLDRLSRTLYGAIPVIQDWKTRGIHFIATHEPSLTMDTPDGEFFMNLSLSVAQKERQRVGERIRFTFEQKRARGEPLSGVVAVGYKKSDTEKKVEVDPEGKELVNFVYDYFIATRNVYGTVRATNEKYKELLEKLYKDSPRRPNDYGWELTPRIIRHMLKNEKYKGNEIFPQIVEVKKFEEAKEILEKRSVRTVKKYDYIFGGLVICGNCGKNCAGGTLKRKKRKSTGDDEYSYYINYRCTSFSHGESNPDCVAISEPKLEKLVLNELKEEMQNEVVSGTLTQSNIQNIEEDIKKQKEKIKRIANAYIDGLISREAMLQKKKATNEIIRQLEKSLDADKHLAIDGSALDAYIKLSVRDKNLFWKQLIKNIRIYKGGSIAIEWK